MSVEILTPECYDHVYDAGASSSIAGPGDVCDECGHPYFSTCHGTWAATTAAATGDAAPLDVEPQRLYEAIQSALLDFGYDVPPDRPARLADNVLARLARLSEPARYAFDPDEFEAVVNDAMGLPPSSDTEPSGG